MGQASQVVLNTPHLLAKYKAKHGTPEELEFIVAKSIVASNSKSATLAAAGDSQAATAAKSQKFLDLLEERDRIRAGMQATITFNIRLMKVGPEAAAIRLQKILDNSTEWTVTDFTEGGTTKRVVDHSGSDEAIRQEDELDSKALLDFIDEGSKQGHAFAGVVKALDGRGITRAMVETHWKLACSLAGTIKETELKRGTIKERNEAVHNAVNDILVAFGGVRKILNLVALDSPELANVLEKTKPEKHEKPAK